MYDMATISDFVTIARVASSVPEITQSRHAHVKLFCVFCLIKIFQKLQGPQTARRVNLTHRLLGKNLNQLHLQTISNNLRPSWNCAKPSYNPREVMKIPIERLRINPTINYKIDIVLISETRFTNRSYIQIPKYKIYDTKHPDGRGHSGTAIIIKANNTMRPRNINTDWNDLITRSAALRSTPLAIKYSLNFSLHWETNSYLVDIIIQKTNFGVPDWQQLEADNFKNPSSTAILGTYQVESQLSGQRIANLLDFAVTKKKLSSNYINAELCLEFI